MKHREVEEAFARSARALAQEIARSLTLPQLRQRVKPSAKRYRRKARTRRATACS